MKISGENTSYKPNDKSFVCGDVTFEAQFDQMNFCEKVTGNDDLEQLYPNTKFDLIVFHFVNHEVYDRAKYENGDYIPRAKYIKKIFSEFEKILDVNGSIFLGDIYYPLYLSAKDSYETVRALRAQYGNADAADAPAVCFHPERMLEMAFKDYWWRFETCYDDSMLFPLKDNNKVHHRKSYLIVLRGKSQGANYAERFDNR
jgi:hypothetical protein